MAFKMVRPDKRNYEKDTEKHIGNYAIIDENTTLNFVPDKELKDKMECFKECLKSIDEAYENISNK